MLIRTLKKGLVRENSIVDRTGGLVIIKRLVYCMAAGRIRYEGSLVKASRCRKRL